MKNFKLGLKPARHDPRTPKYSQFVNLEVLPYPPNPAVDWFAARAKLGVFPVWANDKYGDCFWAAMANLLQVDSANSGQMIALAESDVLAAYSACTGFKPDDPSTDQGTDMLDGLRFMQSTGIAGNKIGGFMSVNPSDQREIVSALWLFGHLIFGVSFYNDWEDKNVWTLPDTSGVAGGHAILGGSVVLPAATSAGGIKARGALLRKWLTKTIDGVDPGLVKRFRDEGLDMANLPRKKMPLTIGGPSAIRIASWGSTNYQIPWAGFAAVDQLYVCLTPSWASGERPAPNGFSPTALQDYMSKVGA